MEIRDNSLKSLMVVDDDDQLRNLLKEIFSRINYQVITACDGADALKKMMQVKVDLVILDLIMPEKEGIETLSDIRVNYPETKIMAVSGGSHQLNAPMLLNIAQTLGADDVLKKPFDLNEIIEAVDKLLN
ncbi:MAG: response regulator [Calditrichae bacterium]|nr:response regulator [Calditrichota bacterium]MCB9058754.1 response regulator [Calditrichia bacterium]